MAKQSQEVMQPAHIHTVHWRAAGVMWWMQLGRRVILNTLGQPNASVGFKLSQSRWSRRLVGCVLQLTDFR